MISRLLIFIMLVNALFEFEPALAVYFSTHPDLKNRLPKYLLPFEQINATETSRCTLACSSNNCSSFAFSRKVSNCLFYQHTSLSTPLPALTNDYDRGYQMYYQVGLF